MQKSPDQINLQLHHVLTEITGLSGHALDAILGGERDSIKLAQGYRVVASTLQIRYLRCTARDEDSHHDSGASVTRRSKRTQKVKDILLLWSREISKVGDDSVRFRS
jgi:hypothetical protein